MLLQYIHIIFLPHDAIYFVKCTSPSCSKAPPKHDAATPVLHGWGLQASPFSSKHNDGHYSQTVPFLFHQTRGHFSKKYDLCPHVHLQTVVWLFLWSSGSFLADWPFKLCRYRTRFTVDIDTFVPVSSSIFTRSFAVVLGLICFSHQSTFISRRQKASPSLAV